MCYRSNKTYESLGTKDAPNVYDDLENAIGVYDRMSLNKLFFCAKDH